MRRYSQALVASTLVVTLAALPSEPLLAAGAQLTPLNAEAATTTTQDTAQTTEAEAATSDQVSPLLITEVQTDQPSGKRYTYTEVYDIPTGDPDKVAIQYSYSGSGRTCEKSGISAATPGSVDPSQVPSTPVHAVEHQAEIKSATADGTNGFTVTANVPYEGTSATSFVTLHYRQTIGGSESEEQTIEMTSNGDGKTFTASIPDDQLYGSSVTWYVTANGDSGTSSCRFRPTSCSAMTR